MHHIIVSRPFRVWRLCRSSNIILEPNVSLLNGGNALGSKPRPIDPSRPAKSLSSKFDGTKRAADQDELLKVRHKSCPISRFPLE